MVVALAARTTPIGVLLTTTILHSKTQYYVGLG